MRSIIIIFLIAFSIQTAFAFDLEILKPRPENYIEVVVYLNHDARQYEEHYVMFTSKNFKTPPIYLNTTDNKVVSYDETRVPVEKHDSTYKLYLSCDFGTLAGEYQFTIHTYALNPNSGKIDEKTVQNLNFTFQIAPVLTLEEIEVWHPPKTGESWESNIVSTHTLRVTSTENWQLSLQGIQSCEGLHAVLFERDPVVLTTHRNILVKDDLTIVFDAPNTTKRTNNEAIFTVILYVDDFSVVPAGEIDLNIYVEAETLPKSILNITI
ncbi:MAG: hypothetical protein PHD88_02700 [Firmicutes bacterium]|nr:hypothetical protein [Bacillota bacterium]MDD4263065.1 hypothetical protein [Bacillota bacterium]MDD4693301.1 hypothetical protein [Bacillota bacterium]